VATMKNERTRMFFELIQHDPGVVQEALAKRVGITAPAAFWHLKRLEEVGMIGRVKKGRKVHYYANEQAKIQRPDDRDGMEVQ
ncbi:MAG TPA: winged helix-turn-helix transcriptional regulator, partial [Candidatus Thermoplasmatota archaeon]|nr:winged helix-turn-helix transcriptional regulator [Candidatus Thermoplasmatota archaeon]